MCSNQRSDPLRCRRWITQGERPSLDERRRRWPHLDDGGGTRGGGSRGGAGRGARRLARRCRVRSAAAHVAAQGEEHAPPQGAPPTAAAPLLGERGAWGGMHFFLLRRSLFLFLLYFLLAVQDIPCTRIYVATRTESRLQSQDTRRCNWRSIRTNRMRAAHFLRGGERPMCWRLRAAHARVDAGPPRMGVACFCRAQGREVFLWYVQLLY